MMNKRWLVSTALASALLLAGCSSSSKEAERLTNDAIVALQEEDVIDAKEWIEQAQALEKTPENETVAELIALIESIESAITKGDATTVQDMLDELYATDTENWTESLQQSYESVVEAVTVWNDQLEQIDEAIAEGATDQASQLLKALRETDNAALLAIVESNNDTLHKKDELVKKATAKKDEQQQQIAQKEQEAEAARAEAAQQAAAKQAATQQPAPKASRKDYYYNQIANLTNEEQRLSQIHSSGGVTSKIIEGNTLIYQMWDGELNRIWGELPSMMSEAEFKSLTAEQLDWIQRKEANIKDAEYNRGPIESSATAINETRARVQYLVDHYVQ